MYHLNEITGIPFTRKASDSHITGVSMGGFARVLFISRR
jgi:hypothetical protein